MTSPSSPSAVPAMLTRRWVGLCSRCRRVAPPGGLPLKGPGRLRHAGFPEVPERPSGGLAALYGNRSVQRYVRRLMEEHSGVSRRLEEQQLSEPDRRLLLRRLAALLPVAEAVQGLEQAHRDLQEVQALLLTGAEEEDQRLVQLLREEEAQIHSTILALRKQLIRALVPFDPLDPSDVVLEVVSGRTTGGDICQQFTREVLDMYRGYAGYKDWDWELLNYSPAEYGGLHHAAVRVAGRDAFRHLKHEGGTHRVQRIPEVGLSSRMQRIHTGTMTVIVLPQPPEVDLRIDPKDLRVDTFRARGPGGQGVNTTDSAVRVVHLPTGTTAECQQSRSQLQNRDTAMRALRARLSQSMMGKEAEQRLAARRQQVGTRSQAERIRTYNFSQDRVTDHRTGYTTRDIKEFMKGGEELDELISELLEHSDQEALLEVVETSGCGAEPPADS